MIALAAFVAQITTLLPPDNGFAIDFDGTVLAAKAEEGKVRVARYKIERGQLVETKTYSPVFDGALEILPKRDGFVVGDYESGVVMELSRDGNIRWKTKSRYPTMLRLDSAGNVWAHYNSGYIVRKTPDSSDFEHLLHANGLEVVDASIDIVPNADGTFYSINDDGDIRFFGTDRKGTRIARVPSNRMIESKLGGVLCYTDGKISHVSRTGVVRELTRLPEELAQGVGFFSRSPDGKLMVGKKTATGGLVIFLDPSIEK